MGTMSDESYMIHICRAMAALRSDSDRLTRDTLAQVAVAAQELSKLASDMFVQRLLLEINGSGQDQGSDHPEDTVVLGHSSARTTPDAVAPGPVAAQIRRMFPLWHEIGYGGKDRRDERLAITSKIVGREISSTTQLTKDEASKVIEALIRRRSKLRQQTLSVHT